MWTNGAGIDVARARLQLGLREQNINVVRIYNRILKLVSMSSIKSDRYITMKNPVPYVNSSILAIKRESFSRVFIIGVPVLAWIGSDLNPHS